MSIEAVESRFGVKLAFGQWNTQEGLLYSGIARKKGGKVVCRTTVSFESKEAAALAVGEFLGKKEMEE